MHLAPPPLTLSVIIDGAYVHRIVDTIAEVVAQYPPPKTVGRTAFLDLFLRSPVFWAPIMNGTALALEKADPRDARPHSLRTFVFDALFIQGAHGLLATAGETRLRSRERLSRSTAHRIYTYQYAPWQMFQSDPAPSETLIRGVIHGPRGDFEYSLGLSLTDYVRTGTHGVDEPGLYLGHLTVDDDGDPGQKRVDTMMTMCMMLEAQKGHTIVFVGQDTDLIPVATYAARQSGFHLCSLDRIPGLWTHLPQDLPNLHLRQLPLLVPTMNSWDDDTQRAALADVAERLHISEDRVGGAPFDFPTLIDADLIELLQKFRPASGAVMRKSP